MATISHDDLRVCIDCTLYLANGEVSDENGYDITSEHGERILAEWGGDRFPDLALNCPEYCEGEFSYRACDGCGSTLGGDRHPAVCFAPEPITH